MNENQYKKIVHEVLSGIIEATLLVREETSRDGVRIAHGSKHVDVEFNLRVGDTSAARFNIPISIPNLNPEAPVPSGPWLPITGSTKIEDAGFSGRVKHCLRRGDIRTVHDLLAIPDRKELLSIHGLGYIALQEIEDFIAGYETQH
jgi:hypothetical protein